MYTTVTADLERNYLLPYQIGNSGLPQSADFGAVCLTLNTVGKRCALKENFHTEKLNEYFFFTLKPGSRILSIRKSSDLEPLPKLHESEQFQGTVYLDYEKLTEKYDAIELFVYGDFDLQSLLGTWDCDYVLVLNPDAVQELPNEL